jgi:predicted RNase H-like HicB family nuclease
MIVPESKIRLRRDENGVWIAQSPALPGCHAHGRDRGEAILRFQEAAQEHLEALLESGRPIPAPFRAKFVGQRFTENGVFPSQSRGRSSAGTISKAWPSAVR